MNVKIQYIVTAISILMVCVGSSLAAPRTWKNNTTGDWFTAANWNEGAVPVAGDDVAITNTGAYVLLSSSTETNLSSLTLSRTMVFTNWDSALNATNVTILTNGTMKLPAAFTNDGISNNMYVVCSNLTIETGSSINADAKGYSGGVGTAGHGPGGGGVRTASATCAGGGYGGHGGNLVIAGYDITGGPPYSISSAPMEPGSGAGGTSSYKGGDGGGAITIIASGTVTINGTITANGGIGVTYGGGGSGGGICITCNKLMGTNGIVRAIGGDRGTSGGGGGGGGRIAVIYDQAAQSNAPVPDVTFSVLPGTGIANGDIGTLYFPDTRLFTENIRHNGQWLGPPGFTNWAPNNLTISNVWIRFPADGFQLAVSNDVTIMDSAGRLDLGNVLWINMIQCSGNTNAPVLEVGGNLTLTNGGDLYVYSGMTNAATTNYGALVSVTNDVFIASAGCWVYGYSHWTNGGSPLFRMRNLFIVTNAGFSGSARGFAGGMPPVLLGYGPGRATKTSGGGGYGGQGGDGYQYPGGGGVIYGNSNAPASPGSGGAIYSGYQRAGSGGGLVWIHARGTLTLNGTIAANGENRVGSYAGGGSGGGIYITTKEFAGTNGSLSAYGGNGEATRGGGGGGGRIAVWRVNDKTGGTIQTYVNGGTGWSNGVAGTVVWGWIPPARTIIRVY